MLAVVDFNTTWFKIHSKKEKNGVRVHIVNKTTLFKYFNWMNGVTVYGIFPDAISSITGGELVDGYWYKGHWYKGHWKDSIWNKPSYWVSKTKSLYIGKDSNFLVINKDWELIKETFQAFVNWYEPAYGDDFWNVTNKSAAINVVNEYMRRCKLDGIWCEQCIHPWRNGVCECRGGKEGWNLKIMEKIGDMFVEYVGDEQLIEI